MLVRDPNYRTRLGATLGLGELGYPKAEDELERIADAEPMSNLRTNARKAIATLREKHAEAAKKVEQQEELDKLKDENKELRARITAIEARGEAVGRGRKHLPGRRSPTPRKAGRTIPAPPSPGRFMRA